MCKRLARGERVARLRKGGSAAFRIGEIQMVDEKPRSVRAGLRDPAQSPLAFRLRDQMRV
jgi:hypothetical protein